MIREAARSPILGSLLESVASLSVESRRRSGQSLTVRRKAVADHGTIVRAIKSHTSQAAYQVMIDHLSHTQEGLCREP